jgi:hypothetical protein
MTEAAYTSRSNEYAADKAELLVLYRAEGFEAASVRCGEIADARGLNAGQRLTLADAVRRHIILGA